MRLLLQSAGVAPGRVLQALRQSLGLGPREAQAFVAAAPVVLAVDVPPAIAEGIRATLVAAGATVLLEGHPVAAPEPEPEPEPEPVRRLAVKARDWQRRSPYAGTRTVTGLDVGGTSSRLAYVRAEGAQAITHPDLLRFDTRTSLPNALRLDADGRPVAYGAAAREAWPSAPESLRRPALAQTGLAGGDPSCMRHFLEGMARRLSEVIGAAALDVTAGATTVLGVPATISEASATDLATAAVDAGFPVQALVPWPLAAIAHHEHQGALPDPAHREQVLVVDWGGTAMRLSVVERGRDMDEPVVIDDGRLVLGGDGFDALLTEWMLPQLAADLSDEDRRSLELFVRDYKEQLARSLAEGKGEHSQYCVVPAGAPPTRLRLSRSQWEAMVEPVLEQFSEGLLSACASVGLQPRHIEQVILVGGSGRWPFARETIRKTLGRVPHIGPRPDEAIALGLAVHGLEH